MLARFCRHSLFTAFALAACGEAFSDSVPHYDVTYDTQDTLPIPSEPSFGGLGAKAIALGPSRLVVAHHDLARGGIYLSMAENHIFTAQVRLTADGSAGSHWFDVALESDGQTLQVVWFDKEKGQLNWGRGTLTGAFFTEVLPLAGINASHIDVALDARNLPHLVYRDENTLSLNYATRASLDSTSAWSFSPIEACPIHCTPGENYGEWAQIALMTSTGGAQRPVIAYYDRQRGDLMLASRQANHDWQVKSLDGSHPSTGADTGDVGRFISLALTPNRNIGLAYFDASRGALRYLGPDEEPRTLDYGAYTIDGKQRSATVGQYVSLRYDTQGIAHLIYTDSTRLQIRSVSVRQNVPSTPQVLDLPTGAFLNLVQTSPTLYGVYARFLETSFAPSLQFFEVAPPSRPYEDLP